MKRILTVLIICICFPVLSSGQFGFIPQYVTGDLNLTDLTNTANTILIGTTLEGIGASDFDQNGNLFAISAVDDNLYLIDTSDASATFIGFPGIGFPSFWTGMAFDPVEDIMYVCNVNNSTSNFYTIDLTNASLISIGSNTAGNGVVGIAFDDDGQMYAICLGQELYKIDKTNGAATFVGNISVACDEGLYHGLDFCSVNQTMYMVSYGSGNAVYTIDLETGVNQLVGPINLWAGAIAWQPTFNAALSTTTTEACEGDTVQFNDNSTGVVTSWVWTFEGGTPSSSTDQDPEVIYNTAGIYDVQLIISDGTTTDTLLKEDYISVEAIPAQCNTPSGPLTTCNGLSEEYSTTAVLYADIYTWVVEPDSAGTISGTNTIGTFVASDTYTGNYSVKVRAEGSCGYGAWSTELTCGLYIDPLVFTLSGNGSYCDGEPGAELILDGSETGVNYELYIDDVASGIIEPGTGDTINFGYHTDEGLYSCKADNNACIVSMIGQIWVHMQPVPGQAGTPSGPEEACNNEQADYTTSGSPDADTLIWNLDPPDAGIIVGSGVSITIAWDELYAGIATLTVFGQNGCGDGPASDPLEVEVFAAPAPEISGEQLVCKNEEADYQTPDNPGSSYSWEVTGGSIILGSGTHLITVKWGDPGVGTVVVTEENAEGCFTSTDTFEVIIDECTGIDGSVLSQHFKIYPNPSCDKIYFKNTGEAIDVSINSLQGKELTTRRIINSQLDISDLKRGVYILRLHSANTVITHKLVVQ